MFTSLITVVLALAGGYPRDSADVVRVTLKPCSYADGLEGYAATLTMPPGWYVPKRVPVNKPLPIEATVVVDGKPAAFQDVWFPDGVNHVHGPPVTADGYPSGYWFVFWLPYDDAASAGVRTARVTITVTDGKRTLKPAVIIARE